MSPFQVSLCTKRYFGLRFSHGELEPANSVSIVFPGQFTYNKNIILIYCCAMHSIANSFTINIMRRCISTKLRKDYRNMYLTVLLELKLDGNITVCFIREVY